MRPRWVTTLGLLALAGCGGGSSTSACDVIATGLNDLITKATPCFSSPPPEPVTAEQCRQQIGNCSDADKQKLTDFGHCLSALPTCSQATLSTWESSLEACVAKLQGISDSC